MKIAVVADDAKKELMVQFCIAYLGIIEKHDLSATGDTGKQIEEATGIKIQKFLGDKQGGLEQIAARIDFNEIDMLLFFRDPMRNSDFSSNKLLQLCDLHGIPVATNIATAEVLIHGLGRGDLEWRNILNPRA